MTEKVKVSQEVANAIVYLKKAGYDFDAAMEVQVNVGWENWDDKGVIALNSITPKEFAIALLVGYKIVKTPHEIIRSEYESRELALGETTNSYNKGVITGYMEGMLFVLEQLDEKVKGVNDDNGDNYNYAAD